MIEAARRNFATIASITAEESPLINRDPLVSNAKKDMFSPTQWGHKISTNFVLSANNRKA